MEAYKFNIYVDKTRHGGCEIYHFLHSEPIYLLVPNENFIVEVYKLLEKQINRYYWEHDLFNEELTIEYYKNPHNYLYEEKNILTVNSDNYIDGLLFHKDFAILSFESDYFWSHIYIQFVKTSSKANSYTLEEIDEYIRNII